MKTVILFAAFLALPLAAETFTPAQNSISYAEAAIKKDPKQAQGHIELALALVKRARETDDPKFLDQAEREIDESLKLEKDSFEAQKVRVMVLLARRNYLPALELARKLNKLTPDDVLVYGLVADACMALGEYKEAETSAQWMLDLRRGNLAGLQRGAFLREMFGDIDGAVEWLTSVFKLTSTTESEERAWVLTHIARLNLSAGKIDVAEKQVAQAVTLFPEYYFALRIQADVRSAQERHAEAAGLLRRVVKGSGHPRNRYALAQALRRARARTRRRRRHSRSSKKWRGRWKRSLTMRIAS